MAPVGEPGRALQLVGSRPGALACRILVSWPFSVPPHAGSWGATRSTAMCLPQRCHCADPMRMQAHTRFSAAEILSVRSRMVCILQVVGSGSTLSLLMVVPIHGRAFFCCAIVDGWAASADCQAMASGPGPLRSCACLAVDPADALMAYLASRLARAR